MKKISFITTGLAGASILAVAGMGVASAATNNSNIGTSGIPRSVYKQERLDAVAQVLGTTTSNVQTAHKDKDFKSLVSKAGLTKTTFREKVKTQLTSDLEAKGYSQDQVTIALQHKTIAKQHHKIKSSAKS